MLAARFSFFMTRNLMKKKKRVFPVIPFSTLHTSPMPSVNVLPVAVAHTGPLPENSPQWDLKSLRGRELVSHAVQGTAVVFEGNKEVCQGPLVTYSHHAPEYDSCLDRAVEWAEICHTICNDI